MKLELYRNKNRFCTLSDDVRQYISVHLYAVGYVIIIDNEPFIQM